MMGVLDSAAVASLFGTPQADAEGFNRRDFLKSAGAAGLVLALQLPLGRRAEAADVGTAPAGSFAPNAFVRIAPDDSVTVVIKHHEMGQGSTTGLATILAEELDADYSRLKIEYAPANVALYKNLAFGAQGTGGSTAIANSWMQLREAGATARAMLVSAAAQQWKIPAEQITVSDGLISGGGKQARFGEFATAAAKLPVPAKVSLKDPKNFKLVGKQSTRRVDSAAKSNGTATYTIDVKLPGLLTAVIARPPAFGAVLKSHDASAAKAVRGVTDVVQIPEGVAVVGKTMWAALQGRRALKLEWAPGEGKPVSTEAIFADYRKLATTAGTPVHRDPQTAAQLKKAARKVEATYEFPYLAHAAMEPVNCVAWLHDGIVETWGAHQFPTFDHAAAAKAAELPMDKVKLNTLISGGSFGRRANTWCDFTVEAIHVAKALGRSVPVRVQSTREDDMSAGMYRPMYVHQVSAGLDAKGQLIGWQHAIVGQSIVKPTPMAAGLIKNGVDETTVEGVHPTPYTIPAMSAELHSPEQPVRPLWWRSVGHTHTAFVMETMMDELAAAAGKDPLEFRLALLKDQPRMAGVLRLAADKAGWNTPLPKGKARGLAGHFSFNSYVAQVAEVSLRPDGQPRVERVIVAVDCGVAVNPDQIASQMEGCVGFALAAALYGEIGIEDGVVQQTNFDRYRVLRMHEMPKVEVHIVPSQEAPTGVGEPGVPPLAPAVVNALARLTGQRVRRLPLARSKFQIV